MTRLQEMHPELSPSMAWYYWHQGAIGLTRHHDYSGVDLRIIPDDLEQSGNVHWLDPAEDPESRQRRVDVIHLDSRRALDYDRVTEDAAYAIALAVVRVVKGWVIDRRLQREEFADWLLKDSDGNRIALEVSGVDSEVRKGTRLRRKLGQVRRCKAADTRAACVVELRPPRSKMRMA